MFRLLANTKSLICVTLLSVFLGFLPGCDWFSTSKPVKRTGLVIVDVLPKEQYDDCHIAGAINIPFGDDFLDRAEREIDKNAEIVVYCTNYMCTASATGVNQLRDHGFTSVRAYEAGITDWYKQELPVIGACTMPYLKGANNRLGEHAIDPEFEITTIELKEKVGG